MAGRGQIAPTAADIEALARAALARLPQIFRNHVAHVPLIVEEFADDSVLGSLGIVDPFALSGLYAGRPVGEPVQTGDPPPVIHLYRRAILDEWAENGETLDHLVAHVLIHEVGHHFGLSDADMRLIEDAAS